MLRVSGGLAVALICALAGAQPSLPSTSLANVAWPAAEVALTPSTVVVIPIGGSAVEHGRHLPLDTDERLARYFAARVSAATPVVVAPPVTYEGYPAFLDYPGSTSLAPGTARDLVVEVIRSLAHHGPHRFYALYTDEALKAPVAAAADAVAADGILLRATDPTRRTATVETVHHFAIAHADEIETSLMLYVDPERVDLQQATPELTAGEGALTRELTGRGIYSRSGAVGDPTLATRENGKLLAEALVSGMLADVEAVRTAALPPVRPPVAAAPRQGAPPAAGTNQAPGCTPQDEREIRAIGAKFSVAWHNQDVDAIGGLFTPGGDIHHPDGSVERGPETIKADRGALFRQPAYQRSQHPVTLNEVRCIGPGVAIADGKWELRDIGDKDGMRTPFSGLCTLVVHRAGDTWQIEAWRYTVDPPDASAAPNVLKKPGFIGRGGGGVH
jgi:creatinine amidohydrolase